MSNIVIVFNDNHRVYYDLRGLEISFHFCSINRNYGITVRSCNYNFYNFFDFPSIKRIYTSCNNLFYTITNYLLDHDIKYQANKDVLSIEFLKEAKNDH